MTSVTTTIVALVTATANATVLLLESEPNDPPNDDNPWSGIAERRSYIGVLVAIIGNICISAALNIQKHVHNRLASQKVEAVSLLASDTDLRSSVPSDEVFNEMNDDDDGTTGMDPQHVNGMLRMRASKTDVGEVDEKNEMAYLWVPDWWIGMGLMTLGECGNFAAYGFAPAVLVAPLGTVALIANAIVAPIFLKETFRQRDLLGIFFAIAGTVTIIVVSSQTDEPVLTPDDIALALRQTQFIVYFVFTVIYGSVMAYLSMTDYSNKFIIVDLSLVAVAGGYTVLSTKAISSLLNLNIGLVFTYGVTYAMLLVLVATAVLQIKYLNKSLSKFDSTEVIPTNFVLFTTSTIIGSAVLYHDFSRMSQESVIMSFVGIGSMFVGVYLITGKRRNAANDGSDESSQRLESGRRPSASTGRSIRRHTPTTSRSGRSNSSYIPLMVEDDDEDILASRRQSRLSISSTKITTKAVTASKTREQVRKNSRKEETNPKLSASVPVSRVNPPSESGTFVIELPTRKLANSVESTSISESRTSFFTADDGISREDQLEQIAQSYVERTTSNQMKNN